MKRIPLRCVPRAWCWRYLGAALLLRRRRRPGLWALSQPGATTAHPDAQWFPDAALGLFLHWDEASVKGLDIGWWVIPGRPIAARKEKFSAAEVQRIVRDRRLSAGGRAGPSRRINIGRSPGISTDAIRSRQMAEGGQGRRLRIRRAHHEASQWVCAVAPASTEDFSTKNYMGGRDLRQGIRRGGAAERTQGRAFIIRGPTGISIAIATGTSSTTATSTRNARRSMPISKPRTMKPYGRGTRGASVGLRRDGQGARSRSCSRTYGKIDLIWFDGKPDVPNPETFVTVERIRELQPGIVINPRLHGQRRLHDVRAQSATTWPRPLGGRSSATRGRTTGPTQQPFRANGFVLGQLAQSRSLGINYLLGVGPMASGDLEPAAYANMAVVAGVDEENRRGHQAGAAAARR